MVYLFYHVYKSAPLYYLQLLSYYYVMEYIQVYNMQNRYHIAYVTYQQPLTSQKVIICSALHRSKSQPCQLKKKKKTAPVSSLFYCYKTFILVRNMNGICTYDVPL